MDEIKKQRATAKAQFTRAEKTLKNDLEVDENTLPLVTVERHYKGIMDKWEKIQDIHDEYVASLEDPQPDLLQTEEAWIDELSARFHIIEIATDTYIERRKSANAVAPHPIAATEAPPNVADDEPANPVVGINMANEAPPAAVEQRPTVEAPANIEALPTGVAANANVVKPNVVTEQKPPVPPKPVMTSRLKIQPLSIQHFTGDIRRFSQFKDEFNSLIKPLCAPNQLALALKNHISDDVRYVVDSIGNDFDKIWERLELKYGNTRRLVDAILLDVKNMQVYGDEIADALQMINAVEKAHLDLESLGEEQEMYNSTIISLIEERMSGDMKSEWVKLVAAKRIKSNVKFKLLLELLKNWRYRLEYLDDSTRTASSQQTLHIRTENTNRKQTCWLHKENGDHPIWRCRLFKEKTVDERSQLARDNNACFSCLEVGHNTSNCTKKFRCKIDECNQKHNQLLHKASGSNGLKNPVLPLQ